MTSSSNVSGGVRIWEEDVAIPTYPAAQPDLNPIFLEKRVYQGSSGKVYPNPFTDRVNTCKQDTKYRAVFVENEYIRLMVLPEIGGRIHIGQDKTNNYDFFYRQTVIKPALVGLMGPWISGGVEFNWPQHHRPSTFMPVQYELQRGEDGSCTVWLSEHEPMNRMKGMVGICLRPGKAIIEARVRLYNRTPMVQTFLWWANVGIRVHDQYQAFFPPDVTFVADHAKRAMSSFPIARNFYYGVDYTEGVDISWYKNIPVPTSYMVTRSKYDFFGGYDHEKKAGVVHVADRHIAPGKKLWTWGNADFGYAWDRNLTDSDGPYIELMAGVFTDNQPDFSYLHPFETKSFSQYWYPIQEIGPAKNANRLLAINLERQGTQLNVGVCSAEELKSVCVDLSEGSIGLFHKVVDVKPGMPFVIGIAHPAGNDSNLLLRVLDISGRELIRYKPEQRVEEELPPAATEPPPPAEIESNDRLYITGLHIEQYRHATRSPEPYWREALRRDPLDARCNNALAMALLRRGEFSEAERHLHAAVERLTERNPNPYDSEANYNLGLALRWQGKLEEAYDAFFKATWCYAWQSSAFYALAALDCGRGNLELALEHVQRSLATSTENLKARDLLVAILRRLGRNSEAQSVLSQTLSLDPLDIWARTEQWLLAPAADKDRSERQLFELMRHDAQSALDAAFDYAEVSMWEDATGVLEAHLRNGGSKYPMVFYALAHFAARMDNTAKSGEYLEAAAAASPDYCFPARLEELCLLQAVCKKDSSDARAFYYLGNLLYDKRRYEDAIEAWEHSVKLDPTFSIPWRNLGIAYFNVRRDTARAKDAYRRAFLVNPTDARLLYESDQLDKRTGTTPADRLARFEGHRSLIDKRDDLTVELVTLYNQTGQPKKALEILLARRFSPWEGGEGLVSGQYVWAHFLLGLSLLEAGEPKSALEHFSAAREYPQNLGEGKHLLTSEAHLDYFSGLAAEALGELAAARKLWTHAVETDRGTGAMNYYKALSLEKLGNSEVAQSMFSALRRQAEEQIDSEVTIDYFATSLPNFLLFEDDLAKRNQIECTYQLAVADLGERKMQSAIERLREVLRLDCNHMAAQQELRLIEAGHRHAGAAN